MMALLDSLAAAVVTFTRIPIPWQVQRFHLASFHLPFIGWLYCALLWGMNALTTNVLPADCRLLLILLIPVLLSGAMHEDGLADCADGIFGGSELAQRLTIMKDPRVGSFGVLALIFSVLGSFLAMKSIPESLWLEALAFTLPLSRLTPVLLFSSLPYLKTATSRSEAYISRSKNWLWSIGWVLPVAFFLPQNPWVVFGVFALVSAGLFRLFSKKLGGINGDCLGAAIKVVEVSILWTLAASFS